MNILLVDDDYYVIAALQKKIDWKMLNIETVYTANNVAQAREILEKHSVQILISDIEMPQGSGLELLAWIREQNYSIQAILLTNYADFNYAQKAIELQSFEYFLKPIEFDKLMLIIQKAVVRAAEQQSNEQAIRGGYFWQKNQAKNLEHFWRKLVSSSTSFPLKPGDIAHAIEEQNLSYQMEDLLQPILFNVFPHNGSMGKEEKGLFDFALLNVLYELLNHPGFSIESILEVKDYNWIAILKWNDPPEDAGVLRAFSASFIQKANPYLKCDVCCNIGLPGTLNKVGVILKQLLNMDEELTKCRNQTFSVEEYSRQNKPLYLPPDLAHLEELLNQNKLADFLGESISHLNHMLSNKAIDTSVLGLFRLDIVQLVYSFLKLKGIQAHKLYTGKTNDQLLMHSLSSIEDMEEYLKYLVNTAMEYRDFAAQPTSIAEEIKEHIHKHYGDDLTRNDLAEIVYLNPDYLARLFKRETGVSLGSYVIQVRIAAAKHLLETTNMSVYTIANKTGYNNYSYFSKLFKQEVGLSPNEYKKEQQAPPALHNYKV
ncbi:response regulator [Paenibacillus sp. sgz500992]|uniref:response regulator transcription factor n=1 Tax=Paenibacillus sp. sgz500992 TaxID=3242476 RepID=UPI0036D3E50E